MTGVPENLIYKVQRSFKPILSDD